ncbi:MAG TPA: rhomboid family intramembrane serine protease [Pirellulales bacterium]|nr:rhomboid family intramembrane serine protease [Pirellulales bacterium]
MGLYDRDYLRDDDERPGLHLGGARSMVANLIIVNVGVFLVDVLFDGKLSEWLALRTDTLWHPWNLWQLLTYGFLHSVADIRHIVFNMIGLYFFGGAIEAKYGRREFLLYYLASIVFGGLVWLGVENFAGRASEDVIGASGAVTACTILFVFNYPFQTIYFFGILPMPAWVMGVLFLVFDVMGAGRGSTGIAYEVHLAGALFAYLYWQFHWRLSPWVPEGMPRFRFRRPSLRVHRPGDEDDNVSQERIDQILAKISAQGEASLTREERRALEDASRRYQRRRQQNAP